jgi:tetratricopeptide (TPR) repeat protein
MTKIDQQKQICCLCGTENIVSVLISTNQQGPSDLDTRPSGMIRTTMFAWVHRCLNCGYVAADLSVELPKAAETIKTRAYRSQQNDAHFSDLADDFLCLAKLQESAGQIEPAAWSTLEAAWDCDDEQNLTGSAYCRLRAIELFEKLPAPRSASIQAVLADLYRRTEQFQLASAACQQGLEAGPDSLLKKVLKYQSKWIEDEDAGCHSLMEITGK